MRRALVLLLAAATGSVVAPVAAAPGSALKAAKPIRVTVALPDDGNASMSLLELALVPGKKKTGKATFKVRVVEKVENQASLPAALSVVSDGAVTGNRVLLSNTFVLPHVLETSGTIPAGRFTFDTTIFTTYASGLSGIPPAETATLDVYLFDSATGEPLVASNGVVCPTCGYTLAPRKQIVRIDDLLTAHSAPASCTSLGFGVITLHGSDPDSVNLQGFVVDSHTAPLDLSVFGFEPSALGPAGHAISAGAGDLACGTSSQRATQLTNALRPAPPADFSVGFSFTHTHGSGQSNLCGLLTTTPPQPGAAFEAHAYGMFGAFPTAIGKLDANGRAVSTFLITSLGNYAGQATVTNNGFTHTAVVQSYTVGAAQGGNPLCPAP